MISVEKIRDLMQHGNAGEAMHLCLRHLTDNPTDYRIKLLLARSFHECGYAPFAVRELRELVVALPEKESLKRLLARLDPTFNTQQTPPQSDASEEVTEVIAEAEFEISEIDFSAAVDASLPEEKK